MTYKILITVLLFIVSPFSLAAISVEIDRQPVVADESFRLIFKSNEIIDTEPDFSALKKTFTILKTSKSREIDINNVKISRSQQWVLTLITNKIGVFGIPSFRFGKKYSQPFSINVTAVAPVTKNNNTDNIYIEVETSNTSPYVQAQVLYTARLYLNRATVVSNAALTEPKISGGEAIVEKLGEAKRYETQRNGQYYDVIERQYVIFPQKSGSLKIEPLVFQGQAGTSRFRLFDPFGPQPQTIIKYSKAIPLTVKPIPDGFTGKTWLPTNELVIQEKWSSNPEKLQPGQAVTRTLILKANGLAASHLPLTSSPIPKELKQYPDQPEFEDIHNATGYVGTRHDKIAIIPTEGGNFILPAITIPWWNTTTDEMDIAELPERSIQVNAGINIEDILSEPVTNKTPHQTNERPTPEQLVNPDIDTATTSNWKWLSILFFGLWVATLFLWWHSRNNNKARKELTTNKVADQVHLKRLKHACKNNRADIAKDALLKWAKSNWPNETTASISTIKKYGDIEFQQQLDELNHHLYGKLTDLWDGRVFLTCFQSQSFKEKNEPEPTEKLEPLYKT